MLPVPRRRLCHEEPPDRSRPATGATCRMSPRRARSSATPTTGIPAAASAASPSTVARSRRVSASGPGAQQAWTALPRFIISLRCFQAITSARGSETKPARRNAAATASLVASVPPGNRPTSRIPGTGLQCCSTTPGSRWPVGIITQTPCTSSKKRSSVGSLATPFCTETTGVRGGQHGGQVLDRRVGLVALDREQHGGPVRPLGRLARVRGGAARRSCGCPPARRGSARRAVRRRGASPRATSTTSSPASWSSPPSTPPTAPAPYTIHRMRPSLSSVNQG